MSGILDGKVAVITGGGTGIGAAIARRFGAEGCRVVVAGRRKALIDAVAKDVSGLAVAVDVAVETEVAALFAACASAFGRLDVLINNAAVTGARRAIEDMDMAAFDRTLAVNLRGTVLCIKYAVPLLKRSRGSIINLSSRGVSPNMSDYVASKVAIRGVTRALAQELGPHGVRVNTVTPGTVKTEMFQETLANWSRREGRPVEEVLEARYFTRAALKRMVEPDEVASAALFLASDAAAAITGDEIRVNAGRT